MTRLAEKPPGSWYSVVLRHEHSHAAVFAMGALGGSSTFPVPDLGNDCVCCDAPDAGTVPFDPSMGRLECDPIQVAVCNACRGHVQRNTSGQQVAGITVCIGAGLAIWAVSIELWLLVAFGVLVLFAGIARLVNLGNLQRGLARDGHRAGLEIMASAGQCAVRTMNRRVAEHVLERHRRYVHRAS